MTSNRTNAITQAAAVTRAAEVIGENAGRRYLAGQSYETAVAGAVAEFAARWPRLGAVAVEALGVTL